MRLADLLKALYAIEDAHGNCEVHIDDADTNWALAIQTVSFDPIAGFATIGGHYHDTANPPRTNKI